MGLFSSLGQCVLVLLNIVFVLVSLILLIVGLILKFFPGVVLQFLFDGIQGITHFEIPEGSSHLNTVPLLDDLGMAAFILGFALFAIAFLACCGAYCKWRVLLGAFCVCVVIVIIAIATVGGLYVSPSSPVHSNLKDELSKEVKTEYQGPQNKDVFSLLVNILSYKLECCGFKGPDDFNHTAAWTTYQMPDRGDTFHIDVTPACCNHTALDNNKIQECAKKPPGGDWDTSLTNTQGCYDKILDLLQEKKGYAIAFIIIFIILLLLEMIFAISIIRAESD